MVAATADVEPSLRMGFAAEVKTRHMNFVGEPRCNDARQLLAHHHCRLMLVVMMMMLVIIHHHSSASLFTTTIINHCQQLSVVDQTIILGHEL